MLATAIPAGWGVGSAEVGAGYDHVPAVQSWCMLSCVHT